MQKSPYEKARDENVRQRKELEKELNITNLSKRLDEAEVPDAEIASKFFLYVCVLPRCPDFSQSQCRYVMVV